MTISIKRVLVCNHMITLEEDDHNRISKLEEELMHVSMIDSDVFLKVIDSKDANFQQNQEGIKSDTSDSDSEAASVLRDIDSIEDER